jgi:plasmid maintenance system antidote protein VapI
VTAFTCPCCGARSSNPTDAEQDYCGRCKWWTGDPNLGPPHLANSCPERKTAGETLAEILIDGHMSTFDASNKTGLRPEELEGVIHGGTVINERIAERLAKLGPPMEFWLGYSEATEDRDE